MNKCAWQECQKEAVIEDGFCSDQHYQLWICKNNQPDLLPHSMTMSMWRHHVSQ